MTGVRYLPRLCVLALLYAGYTSNDRTATHGSVPPLRPVDSVQLGENDTAYLAAPTYMAVDPRGAIYVSDAMNGHVLRFDRDGKLTGRFGRKGGGPGEFRAPGAIGLVGDSLLVVADWGAAHLSVFDRGTGTYLRQVRSEGLPFDAAVTRDTVWLSDVNRPRRTSLAVWHVPEDTLGYRGAIQAEYVRSALLSDAHPYATLARWSDTVLVGFTGHPAMFLMRSDGSVLDTIAIPAIRRRGVPEDMVQRFARPLPDTEIASMASALIALHHRSSGAIDAVYLDVSLEGHLMTAKGYLSVLSPDRRRACVDIPVPLFDEGRPLVAFRGDTLLVLEQRAVSDTRAAAFVRSYVVDATQCDWVSVSS